MSDTKKFKSLFEFEVNTTKEVEDKVETQNEDGSITTVVKKEKKLVPQKVFFRKPNRSLYDEAELYYNVCVSQGMQAGLMSQVFVAKRFLNDGGALSKPEVEERAKAYVNYFKDESEFQTLSGKTEKTEEETARMEELVQSQTLIKKKLQDIELRETAIFDITAESRARTKTILWWTLFLTHTQNEKAEYLPVFIGKDIEEKLEFLDEIEDGSNFNDNQKEFYNGALKNAMTIATYWFYNKNLSQEEIDKILKSDNS